jgi:hypothetical protein
VPVGHVFTDGKGGKKFYVVFGGRGLPAILVILDSHDAGVKQFSDGSWHIVGALSESHALAIVVRILLGDRLKNKEPALVEPYMQALGLSPAHETPFKRLIALAFVPKKHAPGANPNSKKFFSSTR